jgi:hypothetical protein
VAVVQKDPHNRYSQPSAPVERPDQKEPMPGIVRLGAWLFGLSNILFYVLHPRLPVTVKAVKVSEADVVASSWPLNAFLGTALALAMLITPFWLLFKAVKRHSWARVALSVVAAIQLVIFLEVARTYASPDRLQWGVWLTDAALQLVALALFFTPSANRWYRGK